MMVSVRRVVPVLLLVMAVPALAARPKQSSHPPRELHRVGDHFTAYNPPDPASYPPNAKTYAIKQGDTLWALAKQFYGNAYLWPQLWESNTWITDAHWIYPGDVLLVEGEVSNASTATTTAAGTAGTATPTGSDSSPLSGGNPAPPPPRHRRRHLLLRLHRRSERADAELHRVLRRRRGPLPAGRAGPDERRRAGCARLHQRRHLHRPGGGRDVYRRGAGRAREASPNGRSPRPALGLPRPGARALRGRHQGAGHHLPVVQGDSRRRAPQAAAAAAHPHRAHSGGRRLLRSAERQGLRLHRPERRLGLRPRRRQSPADQPRTGRPDPAGRLPHRLPGEPDRRPAAPDPGRDRHPHHRESHGDRARGRHAQDDGDRRSRRSAIAIGDQRSGGVSRTGRAGQAQARIANLLI